MNNQELNTVTYNFEDGTKVVQPITKQSYFDEKGRKRTIAQMHNLFSETTWDKKAISYNLEAVETPVKEIKQPEFTSAERKNAKKDYKDFKKENTKVFLNQRNQFRAMVIDKFTNTKMRVKFSPTILISK